MSRRHYNSNSNDNDNNDDNDCRWRRHLDWSAQQGRILTANGRAASYYTAERGFAFSPTELPHYYLMRQCQAQQKETANVSKQDASSSTSTANKDTNEDEATSTDTRDIFRSWKKKSQPDEYNNSNNNNMRLVSSCPIVGAWKRTLFYGGWEHTTESDEQVFNVQTSFLFIDLRLPTTRLQRAVDRPAVRHLHDLDAADLQRLARQHVFGGYTVVQNVAQKEDNNVFFTRNDDNNNNNNTSSSSQLTVRSSEPYPLVCTRHHVMDWNFVGHARNRPNKWYVQYNQHTTQWKEWAYATDEHGQHYYCEHWQSLLTTTTGTAGTSNNGNNNHDDKTHQQPTIVALRQAKSRDPNGTADGLLLVVGSHFNYLLDDRTPRLRALNISYLEMTTNTTFINLVETVDACLAEGNLEAARAWLSLRGGHGQIQHAACGGGGGWTIDAATEFWKEGEQLFGVRGDIQVVVDNDKEVATKGNAWTDHAHVQWRGTRWEIFECNLSSAKELQELFWIGL